MGLLERSLVRLGQGCSPGVANDHIVVVDLTEEGLLGLRVGLGVDDVVVK